MSKYKPAVISPSGPAVFRVGPSGVSLSCLESFKDFEVPPVWGLGAYAKQKQINRIKVRDISRKLKTAEFD